MPEKVELPPEKIEENRCKMLEAMKQFDEGIEFLTMDKKRHRMNSILTHIPDLRFSRALGSEVLLNQPADFLSQNKASINVRSNYLNTEEILGKGQYGVVVLFETRHEPVKKNVAIKIVRKEKLN